MLIALVSLDQVWENKNANQVECELYIEKASKNNCELIIFPEMTLTGFSMNTELIRENIADSPTIHFFCQKASMYKVSIGFGVVLKKSDKSTNNFIIVDSNGEILSNYTKIHPFSFSGENNFYISGDELNSFTISNTNIGLTLCYDLRFPDIFQALSNNCEIIIIGANWPSKRIKHWFALLQARAIENQLYTVGVNRIGKDGNNLDYSKSSAIFDPTGELIEPINSYKDMDIYDINIKEVFTTRSSFPVRHDRRIEFYKSIL